MNWRALVKAQPSTPYTATFFYQTQQILSNTQLMGVYFYDGTKLMGIELVSGGLDLTLRVEKITSVTVDNSTAATIGSFAFPMSVNAGFYARLSNSGSTLSFSFSPDGITYEPFFSESVGTFITPTHYGFGGVNVSAADVLTMSMQSIVLA